MKLKALAGYRDVFGEPKQTYEEILKKTSSNVMVMLLISINSELNSSDSFADNQKRIFNLITYRFNEEQKRNAIRALQGYDLVFGRRYLLAMVVKELKRNNIIETDVNDPVHEYNFFLAYLLIVDEVNHDSEKRREYAITIREEKMPALPLLWAGSIDQFEFNQSVNAAFEIFKLLCISKFAFEKHKMFLKELLNKRGFRNLSSYISSFNQIINTRLIEKKNEPLRKLVFVNAQEGADREYFRSQSCNLLVNKQSIQVLDIKKYPLYETEKRGFMVVDEDSYSKKTYRGPLFDLHRETGLKKIKSFEDYKNDVSKLCLEEICFRSVIQLLVKSKFDTLHFDDNTISKPDLFFRRNKVILMIEFKDYLFPDKIINGFDYYAFKEYIHERFIISNKEKPKGIGQILNNIKHLFNNEYSFDKQLNDIIARGNNLKIFPIICHTDFMFNMPGINEYLNIVFKERLNDSGIKDAIIQDVTLVNFETLFDFAIRDGDFVSLSNLVKRYWTIILKRKEKCKKNYSLDNFLSTTSSFDEMYETIFKKDLKDYKVSNSKMKIQKLAELVGINQEMLDQEL